MADGDFADWRSGDEDAPPIVKLRRTTTAPATAELKRDGAVGVRTKTSVKQDEDVTMKSDGMDSGPEGCSQSSSRTASPAPSLGGKVEVETSNTQSRESLGRLGGPPSRAGSRRQNGSDEVVEPITVDELLEPDKQANGVVVISSKTLRDRVGDAATGKGFGRWKTVIRIGDAEAAFVLGKGGRTKLKIGRVSGCRVNLTNSLDLELSGDTDARARAELYVKLVLQQRRGSVRVSFFGEDRPDLTVVKIPADCVAFVTGQQGHVLRGIEEEWNTLMFFVKQADDTCEPAEEEDHAAAKELNEKLLIFGEERGRRGAELKVMSAVEQKNPTRFSAMYSTEFTSELVGFDTDRILISKEDFSYALGKDGATRRKLAKASHSILEYIGKMAFIAGTKQERERCREYFNWLTAQRTKPIHVDITGRTDVTSILVPKDLIQSIAGPRGTTLRNFEGTRHTFCFIDAENPTCDERRVLIFSHNPRAREQARQALYDQIDRFCAYSSRGQPRQQQTDFVYNEPARRRCSYGAPPPTVEPSRPPPMRRPSPSARNPQRILSNPEPARFRPSRLHPTLDGPLEPEPRYSSSHQTPMHHRQPPPAGSRQNTIAAISAYGGRHTLSPPPYRGGAPPCFEGYVSNGSGAAGRRLMSEYEAAEFAHRRTSEDGGGWYREPPRSRASPIYYDERREQHQMYGRRSMREMEGDGNHAFKRRRLPMEEQPLRRWPPSSVKYEGR